MDDASKNSNSRLFSAVREAQDEALRLGDANEHARSRARLLQALDREAEAGPAAARNTGSTGSRAAWRWGFGTLAAAACAFAIFFAWPGDRTLEFQVDGVQVSANELIVAGDQSRVLDFSDDTRLELAPDSRLRVGDLRDNGATVTLERGSVELAVHHEQDTSWQVAAGPWNVHVTGTRFAVNWDPKSEDFSVAISEGSVRIEGPEGHVSQLRAGDEPFEARGKATLEPETPDIDEGPTLVAKRPDGETPPPRDPPTDDEGESDTPTETSTDEGAKPSKARTPSWRKLYDGASYDKAWAALEAQPGGVEGEAGRVDADDLLDLADLARFTKHRSDARDLLERTRDRFAGSSEASKAAFLLGKMAADSGDWDKAAQWFETYLDERPKGSLAADALGRLMNAYEAVNEDGKARATAERYLDRAPDGPHAEKARKILGR